VRRSLVIVDSDPAVGKLHGIGFSQQHHAGACHFFTTVASSVAMLSFSKVVPAVVGSPLTSNRSFIE
jgi:hypothetical protein